MDLKGTFYYYFFFFELDLKVERDLRGKKSHAPDEFFFVLFNFFFEKKKRWVRSAIPFWPDKAPFCGTINEEYWPGTSFWRPGGMVLMGDSTYRIFQMVSTISSINSGSGLQLQEHPQLFIYFFIKRIEVSDHKIKIKINELRKMEWNAKKHFPFT